MEIIHKWKKNPETFWLIGRRQDSRKPGNILFKININLNRTVRAPRCVDERGRDEVAA